MFRKEVVLVLIPFVIFMLCAGYSIISDVVLAFYYQLKGVHYEWDTVKFLKKKRKWWSWVILSIFVMGSIYLLLPDQWVGRADFRAYHQKDEFTAYYECEYTIDGWYKQNGYVSISRDDEYVDVNNLYTADGWIRIDTMADMEDLYESYFRGSVDGYSVEIYIGEGPIERNTISTNGTELFLEDYLEDYLGDW